MQFKVTDKNGSECIIGAENNKHLEVSVFVTNDVTTPTIEGRAYIFDGEEFIEYNSWDLGWLLVGESVKIEAIDVTKRTDPSKVEFSTTYKHRYTDGTREFIKDNTKKTEERTKRLKVSLKHKDRIIECSFCHKIEGEVKSILPHEDVAVCNECIASHYELLEENYV